MNRSLSTQKLDRFRPNAQRRQSRRSNSLPRNDNPAYYKPKTAPRNNVKVVYLSEPTANIKTKFNGYVNYPDLFIKWQDLVSIVLRTAKNFSSKLTNKDFARLFTLADRSIKLHTTCNYVFEIQGQSDKGAKVMTIAMHGPPSASDIFINDSLNDIIAAVELIGAQKIIPQTLSNGKFFFTKVKLNSNNKESSIVNDKNSPSLFSDTIKLGLSSGSSKS